MSTKDILEVYFEQLSCSFLRKCSERGSISRLGTFIYFLALALKRYCTYSFHILHSLLRSRTWQEPQSLCIVMKWKVPQKSILISYNSTWSILIQRFRVMIVRWQSDLVYTKESILSACDQPYHTNKRQYRETSRLKFCEVMHWQTMV